ncbi:MAG: DsbA family protein [Steroidobacteraceae bacterium]
MTRRLAMFWVTLSGLLLGLDVMAQGVQLITAAGQKEMLADPGTASAGGHDADLSIVEYFDYNCPYCKKLAPDLARLLAQDPKIRLVYKEWPILGDASVYAARCALAAQWQGRYLAAHDALMNGPKLADAAAVDQALVRAGFDLPALKKEAARHAADIDALLARNDAEAHALSLRGTPGLVIGRLLLPGIVDLRGLTRLVSEARQAPP